MSDNNEVKNNNEQVPDFGNVLRNLFEQVKTQTESHRRRVRIHEDRKSSSDEDHESDDEENSECVSKEQKWEVLLNLAESHKLLCRSLETLLDLDD